MNQPIQKSRHKLRRPAMQRLAPMPCLQALGGFVLAGLFAATPANAQCNSAENPAPAAGVTANYADQSFGPGLPYDVANPGIAGCAGTDGGTDEDGTPGFVGQAAGDIHSAATRVSITGASVGDSALSLVARGGRGGDGGNGGEPLFNAVNGGAGGAGGASAAIDFDFSGSIGPDANGNLATYGISIDATGGLGGTGGSTYPGSTYEKTGGTGGTGGAGGSIDIRGAGNVAVGSYAITAEGDGGGGGDGGFITTGDALNGLTGGDGGAGGLGGSVSIYWENSSILAGGNGLFATGSGGFGGAGGGTGFKTNSNQGGDGGGGGDGGSATAVLSGGSIKVTGVAQPLDGGIVVLASGGEGGIGGTPGGGLNQQGGRGGDGGKGGTASATVLGSIEMTSVGLAPSAAVYVNSNGGAGGEGGNADGLEGSAGDGGLAGDGGTAALTVGSAQQMGELRATGALGAAALVQSIGGGGGGGGQAEFNADGGRGAGGGDAGTATADIVNGQMTAHGGSGSALIVQSIGGSGGVGGNAIGAAIGYHVAIGGDGAVGGDGNAAQVNLIGPSILGSLDALGNSAVLVQSIGGAGGAGGSAVVEGSGIFTMAIGGKGGTGGTGGTVDIASSATIGAYGDHAAGIEAQSIGGGGGKGGMATIIEVGVLPAASVSVGGNGGIGGLGNTARITNSGSVSTFGADASGLKAQSIGGGGGSGGAAVARTVSLSGKDIPAISISVATGGTGGSGNTGGLASIDNSGNVTTANHGSHALFAQSVGGGGGTGGDSTAAAYGQGGVKGSLSVSIAVAVGGSGGDGGLGGEADANNSGLLLTMGADAFGMAAQSIGGGGGTGGGGDATATAGNAVGSFSSDVAVGGRGGTGGHGNWARGSNEGGIVTNGDGSDGLFVQSVGGGGGVGGGGVGTASGDNLSLSISVGGNGGGGGNGGDVNAENSGAIVTRGTDAIGIFSQSVGGGGGKAGKAASTSGGNTNSDLVKTLFDTLVAGFNLGGKVTETVDGILDVAGIGEEYLAYAEELKKITKQLKGGNYDIGKVDNEDLAISVGGAGGVGGHGGAARAENDGQVTTFGAQADGLFVQSVGGGGGKGGAATATSSSSDDSRNQSSIGVGGAGGAAGDGGDVTAVNMANAQIITRGVLGFGMVAQSIGGGGGMGGTAGTVQGSLRGISVGVGGSGGAQGHGGNVSVLNDGLIQTGAKHGVGIFAQSIGGGGGVARTMTTDQAFDPDDLIHNPQGRLFDVHGVSLSFSGSENPAGDGGAVTVELSGAIATAGLTAHGVVAQSIGGGGGAGFGGQLMQVDSGATGGTGNGGTVGFSLKAGANIATVGDGAYGILAQSIGGGGGLAGDLANLSDGTVGIENGNILPGTGNAANISIDMTVAAISTTGKFAPALFAQSVGGGGGLLGLNDALLFGTAGGSGSGGETITVSLVGSVISATGYRSPGIMVQNDGSASGKSVITIDAQSSVLGGRDNTGLGNPSMAGAIFIVGGSGNSITNAGRISGIDGTQSAIAVNVFGALDSTTIINSGTIIGSILTPAVGGTLKNMPGGLIDARGVIHLGGSGHFSNLGTLEVGGARLNGTTTLTGDLVQGDSGRLVFAVDFTGGATDQLVVEGHAEIGGAVVVQPSRLSNRTVTILTATQGVELHPVSTEKATDFALYAFPVTVSGNSLQITPLANFTQSAQQFGSNHQAVAGHLQALFDGGASADAAFNRLSAVSDEAAYRSALEQVAGQALGAFGSFRYTSSRTFSSSLFGGCAQAWLDRKSTDRCGWAQAEVKGTTQDASADMLGYTADAHALQLGGQLPLSDAVALTGSLAYEGSKFRDGGARISGDALMGGLGLLHAPGRLELSAGIDFAYAWYKSARTLSIGGASETATASPEQSQAGAHLRAAYDLLDGGEAFVRPFLEGHAVHVSNKAFTEAGTSPFRLAVESQSDTALIGTAGVELGTVFGLSGGMTVRPFASAAVEFDNGRRWTTVARFADQPQSDSFQQTTAGPGTLGRFSIGADLMGAKNIAFSVRYAPEFGKHYTAHSGTARLSILF